MNAISVVKISRLIIPSIFSALLVNISLLSRSQYRYCTDTNLLDLRISNFITSLNTDRLSEFFHWQSVASICVENWGDGGARPEGPSRRVGFLGSGADFGAF